MSKVKTAKKRVTRRTAAASHSNQHGGGGFIEGPSNPSAPVSTRSTEEPVPSNSSHDKAHAVVTDLIDDRLDDDVVTALTNLVEAAIDGRTNNIFHAARALRSRCAAQDVADG